MLGVVGARRLGWSDCCHGCCEENVGCHCRFGGMPTASALRFASPRALLRLQGFPTPLTSACSPPSRVLGYRQGRIGVVRARNVGRATCAERHRARSPSSRLTAADRAYRCRRRTSPREPECACLGLRRVWEGHCAPNLASATYPPPSPETSRQFFVEVNVRVYMPVDEPVVFRRESAQYLIFARNVGQRFPQG